MSDHYDGVPCGVCGNPRGAKLDSRWGPVHIACGWFHPDNERRKQEQQQATQAREARKAEQRARDEALRQKTRTETVTAIVATLRERAQALHRQAGDDTLPYPQGLVHYSVAQELERAAEAIEQAAKEGA